MYFLHARAGATPCFVLVAVGAVVGEHVARDFVPKARGSSNRAGRNGAIHA